MPVCPYGNHRLTLSPNGSCGRCGEDLQLLDLLQRLSVLCFNKARALWDIGQLDGAAVLLETSLALRADFPEALWLKGAIAAREGRAEEALQCLREAKRHGAPIDPEAIVRAACPNAPPAP